MGAKLAATGLYYRLFRDRGFLAEAAPVLSGYLEALRRQIDAGPTGLLPRERFSQDVATPVVGLHAQAVVWQGLRLMGAAWADAGRPALATTCRRLAARLGPALRRAIHASEKRLRDGSLFIPVRLLDDERPYDALSASRAGSYWNLVMPFALASGLLEPGGRQATGVLRYQLLHGSRLLGLVRAGAYALYGDAPVPASGTDQVYGLNMARFLADNDRPDQLVLSLYGHLAAGMARGTFVSGEAASVAPLPGDSLRAMFLPRTAPATRRTSRLCVSPWCTRRPIAAGGPSASSWHTPRLARGSRPGSGLPCGSCPRASDPSRTRSTPTRARSVRRSTSPAGRRYGRFACDSACLPMRGSPPSGSTDGPIGGLRPAPRRSPCRPDPDVSSCSSPSAVEPRAGRRWARIDRR